MHSSNETKTEHGEKTPLLNSPLPWLVLVIGLAITYLSQHVALNDADQMQQARFDAQAQSIVLRIEQRLATYKQVLRGTAGLFAASRTVDRDEFREYIATLQLQQSYIGIQGVGYARIIAPHEKSRYIEAVRTEGFPDFRIRPDGERPLYTPITFLEPFSDRNLRAFGYDMYSEPVRRAALDQARETGQPSISGKVRLVQEDEKKAQAGFLMYFPVYLNGSNLDTEQERKASATGWVYSAFRMDDMMRGILGEHATDVDIEIFDGREASPDSLMYDSNSKLSLAHNHVSRYSASHTLGFNGHDWLIKLDSLPSFEAQLETRRANDIRIGGILGSLLLALLIRGVLNSREQAIRLARKISGDFHESENRWKFAIEGSGDGLWDWNIVAGSAFFSPRWKEMLGFEEHEIGNSLDEWGQRVHPDDMPATLATLHDYLDGKSGSYVSEHRVKCKDGSWKWILDRGMVVSRNSEGKPLRMIGTHTDITREKEAALALQASKLAAERASRLLIESINSISQGFTVYDEEDRLLVCNETYLKIYETSRDLLVPGARFEDIIRQGVARGQYPAAEKDPEGWIRERVSQHQNATGKTIEQNLDDGRWLLITEQRTPSGYIAGNRIDITQRKQIELELESHRNHLQDLVAERTADALQAKDTAEAANRAKSIFLTNISHELRTPMHAILSFGNLGLQKSSGDAAPIPKLHQYFQYITESASRLMVLINDLLDLSRLEAGKMVFDMKSTALNQVVDHTAQELDVLLRKKSIRLDILPLPDNLLLECDVFKLVQVLNNILSNAIKFSPDGSRIELSGERDQLPGAHRGEPARAAIRVEIRDQGPGIPANELEAVFDEFIQSSKTRTGAGGTGLGLSICRQIINAHDGQISATNNPDGGTCIRFVLPLTQLATKMISQESAG